MHVVFFPIVSPALCSVAPPSRSSYTGSHTMVRALLLYREKSFALPPLVKSRTNCILPVCQHGSSIQSASVPR